MIFDTHCHYNLSPLYENWAKHWQKAQASGVTQAIIPGTSIETSRRTIEIARKDPHLFAAVGVHPHEYNSIAKADLPTILTQHRSALCMMLSQANKQIIGIGETGLDYYRLQDKNKAQTIANQKMAFRMHLQLANEFEKVLIVHTRDKGGEKEKNNQAYWDILKLIKNEYKFKKPFILHCVSGPKEYVKQALELGAYIGVDANITYPNANELRELIKLVPKDKLLLETDAPYLPPQEFRGQVCEPWMIIKTAEYVEKELNLTPGLIRF